MVFVGYHSTDTRNNVMSFVTRKVRDLYAGFSGVYYFVGTD